MVSAELEPLLAPCGGSLVCSLNLEQMPATSRLGTLEFVPAEVFKIDPSLLVETDSLLFKENDLRFPYA